MKARWILRIYALLLRLYPRALRRDHGADMMQCARTMLSHGTSSGARSLFTDSLRSLPAEWLRTLSAMVTNVSRDLRYAVRLLWRSPGFSLAACLTLALGIGANTAIFSLADAVMLRPIRVANPQSLYTINWSSSYPTYLAYAAQKDLFDGVIAGTGTRVNAVVDGRADLVSASFVSGNYFGVLGVRPAVGRLLSPADDRRNGPTVAVIGYRWWRTRLAGNPDVVGRTIRVNAVPVTIIGVAAEGFRGTSVYQGSQLFIPVTAAPRVQTGFFANPRMLELQSMVWLNVTTRLKPGVAPEAATAALNAIHQQSTSGDSFRPRDAIELKPVTALGRNGANVYRFVALLGVVVVLTLLIGCSNLATLLLSRAAARRREIGIRMAIGAGRGSIARQLLLESIVLSMVGGTAGLWVASAGLQALARFQLPGGIEIDGLDLGLSRAALGVTALLTIVTSILFGVAPALRASKADVLESLRQESRATTARNGLRSTLVAIQVALSLVLLIGTGLFLRSLVNVVREPLGFDVAHVATASVNLGAARYSAARAATFYDAALERARALPGVTAAAWSTLVPINGSRVYDATVDGYQPRDRSDETFFYTSAVGPEYFAAAGTRILKGRAFSTTDSATAPPVAIVNASAARKYWSGRNPLEGRVRLDDTHWIQIVGVAEDARIQELDEEPSPYIYLPFAQESQGAPLDAVHLFVRTDGDEAALLGPLRDVLRTLDPDAPIYDVSTFAWRVRELAMPQQMGGTLFGAFSALALLLATIGIYGVASYVATLRTREIGIRIALGADRAGIRSLVLRQGATPIVAGMACGLMLSLFGSRLAASFFRGITPHDPATYIAVMVLLGIVALASTWLPARRAARQDPLSALRSD